MAESWTITTHDWQASVDREHLLQIARRPELFAPGGARHLLHEVLAYVADEVEATAGEQRRCDVAVLPDGSVSVRDYGRGTDIRRDDDGHVLRKPVMATRDLRFFDGPATARLPDGRARRGISVVCALSTWLVHENRRLDGAWTQRYKRGLPVGGLTELAPDGSTGTLVHFLPREDVGGLSEHDLVSLEAEWPELHLPRPDRR